MSKNRFIESDGTEYLLQIIDTEYDSIKDGKLYRVQVHGSIDDTSSEFDFCSKHSSSTTKNIKEAELVFTFSYRWRGVWEGRVYFKQEEFWGEDIESVYGAWVQIEEIMKKEIKQ